MNTHKIKKVFSFTVIFDDLEGVGLIIPPALKHDPKKVNNVIKLLLQSFESWYTLLVPLLWPVPLWVALSQTRLESLTDLIL